MLINVLTFYNQLFQQFTKYILLMSMYTYDSWDETKKYGKHKRWRRK